MSPQAIFQTHLVLGYVACLLCFGTYIPLNTPKEKKSM
jgi:hypothetical protein